MQLLFNNILEISNPLSACKIIGFPNDRIKESIQDKTSSLVLIIKQ